MYDRFSVRVYSFCYKTWHALLTARGPPRKRLFYHYLILHEKRLFFSHFYLILCVGYFLSFFFFLGIFDSFKKVAPVKHVLGYEFHYARVFLQTHHAIGIATALYTCSPGLRKIVVTFTLHLGAFSLWKSCRTTDIR